MNDFICVILYNWIMFMLLFLYFLLFLLYSILIEMKVNSDINML